MGIHETTDERILKRSSWRKFWPITDRVWGIRGQQVSPMFLLSSLTVVPAEMSQQADQQGGAQWQLHSKGRPDAYFKVSICFQNSFNDCCCWMSLLFRLRNKTRTSYFTHEKQLEGSWVSREGSGTLNGGLRKGRLQWRLRRQEEALRQKPSEDTAFPQSRKATLLSAAKGMNSSRTKKWPFCMMTCGFLVAMRTGVKGSLFSGLLEEQITGRKKMVRAVRMGEDFLVQWTDSKNYRFGDLNPRPGGLWASTIKEAKVACLGGLGSSFQLCICYFREKQLSPSTRRRQ